jgi:RNA polymerase sigma-70 factor (ECF subfamily)
MADGFFVSLPYHADMNQLPETLLRNHRRFASFLKARVGDDATAEDILQAAYVKAIESAKTVRNEESVVAWFYRLLRNAVVDHYRRKGTESRAVERIGRELQESIEPEVRQELCQCLQGVLSEVKESYRQAVEAVDIEEMSLEEYARREGITANNASVRLHRARRAVRDELSRVCGACATHACLDCGCRNEARQGL